MDSIKDLTATSQVVLQVCDFSTNLRSVFIEYHNRMVEAVGSRIRFECLIVFPWLENTVNPNRDVSDLELDYTRNMKGEKRMDILWGLIEMLPSVDISTIRLDVYRDERSKGEPFYYPSIEFIMVYALLRADYWPVIEDGRLKILKKGVLRALELPDGGTLNGGVTPERKADKTEGAERKGEKKAETKKPDLRLVPKRRNPPKEIMDWCKAHYTRGEWKRILKGLHKFCMYRKRREDKYYPGKSERKNRQYVYGQKWLAEKLGLSRSTVESWFQRFEDDGIIYIPYRGYKERGASVCELAYKDSHRKMNKRKTGERKNPLSIR